MADSLKHLLKNEQKETELVYVLALRPTHAEQKPSGLLANLVTFAARRLQPGCEQYNRTYLFSTKFYKTRICAKFEHEPAHFWHRV